MEVAHNSSEHYARMFLKILREHSQNKQDPISEWILENTISFKEDGGFCICSKDIKRIFTIQNKITHQSLEIGGDCAMRWLEPKLNCVKCKIPLGNILKRKTEGNFLCRSCRIKTGKYQDKIYLYDYKIYTYFELAQDADKVAIILNKNSTHYTDILFLEYCSYFYDFC